MQEVGNADDFIYALKYRLFAMSIESLQSDIREKYALSLDSDPRLQSPQLYTFITPCT